MIDYLIFVPIGYLLGSLPFGLISGWLLKRVDVRDYGSGNIGTTNVMRTVGAPAAVAVLLLDMGKAVLAVVLARLFSDSAGVEVAAALAALFGHNWPIFIGFRGGRGTASGWGALLILSPLSGLVAMLVGVPTIAVSRFVSLGSILATVAGSTTLIVLSGTGHAPIELIWFGAIGGALVVARHKDNIKRLLRGEERKIGQSVETNEGHSRADRRKGIRWPRSA